MAKVTLRRPYPVYEAYQVLQGQPLPFQGLAKYRNQTDKGVEIWQTGGRYEWMFIEWGSWLLKEPRPHSWLILLPKVFDHFYKIITKEKPHESSRTQHSHPTTPGAQLTSRSHREPSEQVSSPGTPTQGISEWRNKAPF